MPKPEIVSCHCLKNRSTGFFSFSLIYYPFHASKQAVLQATEPTLPNLSKIEFGVAQGITTGCDICAGTVPETLLDSIDSILFLVHPKPNIVFILPVLEKRPWRGVL
jgi:hypothetical protein